METQSFSRNFVSLLISRIVSKSLSYLSLDLASLSSVHKFAEEICQITSKVDILVNNAGSKFFYA